MNRSLAIILRALVIAFLVGISSFTASPTNASTINVGCDVNELINAINTANGNPDADILELSAGCEYTLTNVDNTDATLGSNGLPIITTDITINGNNATIERDSAAPNFRLIQINSGATLVLNQVTLTGGATSNRTDASDITDGGAIYNAGTCTLNHATLAENRTGNGGNGGGSGPNLFPGGDAGHGGALYNLGMCALNNTTLRANSTGAGGDALSSGGNGGDGGAIFNAGTLTVNNSALQENSTGIGGQAGNTGKSGDGGAIYNSASGTLNMLLCTLQNNRTADGNIGGHGGSGGNGGALANEGSANVMQSALQENSTGNGGGGLGCICDGGNGGNGGAILNQGHLGLAASTLNDNRTGDGASAIDLSFANGNGGNGGALWNEGSATVSNSTFTENNSGAGGQTGSGGKGGDGGAIGNDNDTILLINVTLSENGVGIGATNGAGGNLYNAAGTIHAHGTIFANPTTGQNCSGTLQDNTGNLRYPKSDASCVGIFGNPKLGPLQDNGGATQTMALALDSLAINAAGVIVQDCPAADQRGIIRPQGKYCDSGAFELQAPTAPALIKPANNAKLMQSTVKLKWSAAERVSHYQVIVRMDSAKGTKVVTKKLTARKFVTPVLESGHWYYWSIKACSKVGCTSSPWQRFRIN